VNSLPSATGAKRAAVMGKLAYGSARKHAGKS
jgi:hypothetical protein